jgi:hypothetical protein
MEGGAEIFSISVAEELGECETGENQALQEDTHDGR